MHHHHQRVDPTLSISLPLASTVTSGINAIAHAAEGLYAQDGNPIMDLMAEQGIAALAHAIPAIYAHASDVLPSQALLEARTNALYGAWLCGTVLGNVGMALHHKLCHTLGGSFNLPHAELHTIILPHALAYNASAAPNAMEKITRALHASNAAQGIFDLAHANGAKVALQDIGMQAEDLDRACDLALTNIPTRDLWNEPSYANCYRTPLMVADLLRDMRLLVHTTQQKKPELNCTSNSRTDTLLGDGFRIALSLTS